MSRQRSSIVSQDVRKKVESRKLQARVQKIRSTRLRDVEPGKVIQGSRGTPLSYSAETLSGRTLEVRNCTESTCSFTQGVVGAF